MSNIKGKRPDWFNIRERQPKDGDIVQVKIADKIHTVKWSAADTPAHNEWTEFPFWRYPAPPVKEE